MYFFSWLNMKKKYTHETKTRGALALHNIVRALTYKYTSLYTEKTYSVLAVLPYTLIA